MRRLFSTLFSFVLLALVAFNSYQVATLKTEVAELKSEVAASKVHANDKSPVSVSVLDKAQKHAELAKKYAVKGDMKNAKVELDKSLQLLQKAGQDTGAPYVEAVDNARHTLDDTRSTIERVLRALDQGNGKEPVKAKGG